MPELRKDPVIGRWVIIATERAKRPEDFKLEKQVVHESVCPFCAGHEDKTPPEIFSIRKSGTQSNDPGWDVRVTSSIKPFLKPAGDVGRRAKGLYDLMNAVGAHEIVIESPDHIMGLADLTQEQIVKVIDAYVERFGELKKDPRFKYVLMFKNHGVEAGAGSTTHSISQLIATPVTPKRVKEELVGARRYYEYKERCVFCDIVKQELEQKQRVIVDIDGIVAITPFASRFPFEVWVLPKDHSCDFFTINPQNRRHLAGVLKQVMGKLKSALNDPPYNMMLHTAPFRTTKNGFGKTVDRDYHWHIEIMPRLTRVAGFEWGTGFYINPTAPELAAKSLRETKI